MSLPPVSRFSTSLFRPFSALGLLILTVMTGPASAETLYWDLDGATAGAGGLTPTGVWDTTSLFWNDATGTGTARVWGQVPTDIASFAAGSDVLGSYEVTLSRSGSAVLLGGLQVRSGQLTLRGQTSGDIFDFGTAAAALDIADGATLHLLTGSSGSGGVVKTGTGLLELDAETFVTGNYAIQAGELRLAAERTLSITALTLGGSAGVTSTLTLEAGSSLSLAGGINFSNVNAGLQGLIQGSGEILLNGTRTINVQNITANPDLTISAVIADGSTESGITKSGNSVLLLSGSNAYSGLTTVAAGQLWVQGDSGSIASSSGLQVNGGATAILGAVEDTVEVDRIGDTATLTFNGSSGGGASVTYQGSNLALQGVHSEIIGSIGFAGAHRGIFTLQAGVDDELEIFAGSLTRSDLATGIVRSSLLGGSFGTVGSSRLFFETAPTLTHGILPWLVVDSSITGGGTSFASYDSVSGLHAVTNGVAPAAAGATDNVVKSAAGAITLSGDREVNSWAHQVAGNINLAATGSLTIHSGAVLFAANATIANGSVNLGSQNEGIIHLGGSANVTLNINSNLIAQQGLILSGAGSGNKVLGLGGTNDITGQVAVYAGTLSLNSAGALQTDGSNNLVVQSGGAVRLNGYSFTISGISGAGSINSNSVNGGTLSTLTIHGGGTYTGTLVNGTAGALGLTKTGDTTLTLGGVSTYTGPTVISDGIVQLNAGGANPNTNGRLTATESVHILYGGTLRINKGNGNANSNHGDRLNDAAPITLSGGTLQLSVNGNGIVYSETVGAVNLTAAASAISSGRAGEGGTSTFTLQGLAREDGSVVTFSGTSLGLDLRNRIEITGQAEGFLGGWATMGNEFVRYVADVDGSVEGAQGSITSFTASDYTTAAANDATTPWSASTHAKPSADQGQAQGLDVSREVLSLNLGGTIDLQLGTSQLTVISGGIIKSGGGVNGTGGNLSLINGGSLTAGNTSDGAELFVRVTGANLNVNSLVTDNNQGGSVALVKSGSGTINLANANTFTGGVFIHEGTLNANNTSGSGTGSGSVFVGPGAILGGTGIIASGPDHSITVNGTLNVGLLNDTVARDLDLQVTGTGLITLNGVVQLDLLTNLNNGSLNSNTGADLLRILAASWDQVQLGNGATLRVTTGGSLNASTFVEGDSWQLFDWSGITGGGLGTFAEGTDRAFANLDLPTLAEGLTWDTSQLFSSGLLTVVIVPEPSRALLTLGGVMLLGLRRRR